LHGRRKPVAYDPERTFRVDPHQFKLGRLLDCPATLPLVQTLTLH
jgi:hypothetical protein